MCVFSPEAFSEQQPKQHVHADLFRSLLLQAHLKRAAAVAMGTVLVFVSAER